MTIPGKMWIYYAVGAYLRAGTDCDIVIYFCAVAHSAALADRDIVSDRDPFPYLGAPRDMAAATVTPVLLVVV